MDHLRALQVKITELQAMAASLNQLIQLCHGDERPECPILDALAVDVAYQSGTKIRPHDVGGERGSAQTEDTP